MQHIYLSVGWCSYMTVLCLKVKRNYYNYSKQELSLFSRDIVKNHDTVVVNIIKMTSKFHWNDRLKVGNYMYITQGFIPSCLYEISCLCKQHLQMIFILFLQICKLLPSLVFLFQSKKPALTLRSLIHLLQPRFSDEGSNTSTFEKSVYSAFLRYLRKVSSKYLHYLKERTWIVCQRTRST